MTERIYIEAITHLGGPLKRYDKLAEESAELSVASHHYRDGKITLDKLAEEVAGVEMLCAQMREIHGNDVFDRATTRQFMKLRKAINEAKQ